jgi:hypothetical protein
MTEIIREGTIKRLHVDKRIIAQNLKRGEDAAPITIQTSRGSFKCHEAQIHGPSTFVYRKDKPLKCGARLWVETQARVTYK